MRVKTILDLVYHGDEAGIAAHACDDDFPRCVACRKRANLLDAVPGEPTDWLVCPVCKQFWHERCAVGMRDSGLAARAGAAAWDRLVSPLPEEDAVAHEARLQSYRCAFTYDQLTQSSWVCAACMHCMERSIS
ncbi:unnamed protein product [Prorocentrum cordatum]|uniref:Uncharacterized protein n=1 Tax=Prorocentrum cordatum TaxID=2364126 RepID=A0ABN9WIP9_9DINO|nr:unnamed protein product [Polarella glacialis]